MEYAKLLSRVLDSQLVNKYSFLSVSLNCKVIQVLCPKFLNPAAGLLTFPPIFQNFILSVVFRQTSSIRRGGTFYIEETGFSIKVPLQFSSALAKLLPLKECYVRKIVLHL